MPPNPFLRRFIVIGLLLPALAGCMAHSEKNKELALAHYRLGEAHLQKGRGIEDEMNRRQAYPEFVEAIKKDPDNPVFHLGLGNIYLYNLQYRDAKSQYEKVLRLDPDNPMAHQNLGQVYQAMEKYPEAIREFNLALANYAYQTPWMAHFNKGRTYFLLEEHEKAVKSFQAAVNTAPGWGAAWESLGLAMEKVGRLGEAEKAFRKTLEFLPDSVTSHYYLGLILYRKKQIPEAVSEFQKVLELEPEGELGKNAANYLSILE